MTRAEYPSDGGCPQRDSAENEENAGARSIDRRETEEADGADLLERILDRHNLNKAYKRVKANKGAPGIDGIYLRHDHRQQCEYPGIETHAVDIHCGLPADADGGV